MRWRATSARPYPAAASAARRALQPAAWRARQEDNVRGCTTISHRSFAAAAAPPTPPAPPAPPPGAAPPPGGGGPPQKLPAGAYTRSRFSST